MLRKIFAVTCSIVLLFTFSVAVFADYSEPEFVPLREMGDPANNGGWRKYYIYGDFQMQSDPDLWINRAFRIDSYWYDIFRDERNSDGEGQVWYVAEFFFLKGFIFRGQTFNSIQILLHAWDQEPTGVINDINLIQYRSNLSVVNDTYQVFHREYDSYVYNPVRLNFRQYDLNNTVMKHHQNVDDDVRFLFYANYFGGYYTDLDTGFDFGWKGIFQPVHYSSPGGDGGGSGGDESGSGGGSPVQGFTEFMRLSISAFRDILSISFFNGFFSLGDLVGVVVAFGLIFMAIKWFAGG